VSTGRVAITVLSVNDPPLAWVSEPTNGQAFLFGGNIEVMTGCSDVETRCTQLVVYADATNELYRCTGCPGTAIWSDAPLGEHRLIAVATDSDGLCATSVAVVIRVERDNDADGLLDGCDPDDDNDTIPDSWEDANGTGSCTNDAMEDPDGDGRTNLDEYIAGTSPTNAASVPCVAGVSNGPGGHALYFLTASGRLYQVQWTVGLSGPWTNLTNGVRGNGGVVCVRDPGADGGSRFYRLRVRLAE
jgi:hypothetical protein